MNSNRVSTGLAGLDEILGGGLPPRHAYLLQGGPGTGKTTMAFHFLMEAARSGKKALYISLLQSEADIREMAAAYGWNIDGIDLAILMDEAESDALLSQQTIFPSSEVQLSNVVQAVQEAVDRYRPACVVFDSIEQFSLIAGNKYIYQQKVLALLRLFERAQTTSLFIHTAEERAGFKTLAHGVISLEMEIAVMGPLRRSLKVEKMRNMAFKGGRHSFLIEPGGITVFPPLPMQEEEQELELSETVASGNEELDQLLGGGLSRGTACLIAGASGTGKTMLTSVYAFAAAERGEHVSLFLFDEHTSIFLQRSAQTGMDFTPHLRSGRVQMTQVGIGELSAGELAARVRQTVEENNTRLVVLDSISGYYHSMPDEPLLLANLHEMLAYLGNRGVLTLMVLTEHGLFSEDRSEIDLSYIADSVMMLRHFEALGSVRLAISVIKKRTGSHERHIREFKLTSKGITLGEPLRNFEGVLTGRPHFVGEPGDLLD